jgi:predicted nuclease of predicted toxin-antitoxin system
VTIWLRFLIDERADARVAAYLRSLGHDVILVAAAYGPALEDAEILSIAVRERRILITFDRDFGELVFAQRQPHSGVLYFRLGPIDLDVEIARLDHVLTHYADRLDHFLTITPRSVRVRK